LQALYQTMAESISRIAELNFDTNAVIFELDDGTPREKLRQLKQAGLLPTDDQLRSTSFWNEDLEGINNESPRSGTVTLGVFDILGEYLPTKKKIIIYTKLCHLTALSTGQKFEDIIAIVIAHEVSHAVTHIGCDFHREYWCNFSAIDNAALEHFAQMYTRMHFIESGNFEMVKVFEVLSEGQPKIYRSWLNFLNFNITMLNGSLLWARWYDRNIMHEASTEEIHPGTSSKEECKKFFLSMQIDSIFKKLTGQEQLIEKAINLGEISGKAKNQIETSLNTIENMIELYFGEENPDGTLNKDYDDETFKSLHDELVFVRERFTEMKHTVKEVLSWTKKDKV